MKLIKIITPIIIIMMASCTTKNVNQDNNKSMMLADSVNAQDKYVTIVKPNDTIRVTESLKNFEDNPNIMATDLDAAKGTESNEVHYVKKGEAVVISESGEKNK